MTSTKQAEMTKVEVTPSLQLPDATSAAQFVLAEALEFCAQKMGLDSIEEALDCLRQSDDGVACGYWQYGVGKKAAEALAALDDNIKAIYVYDYEAATDEFPFGQVTQLLPVHMIALVGRKTNALDSLIVALERALLQNYAEQVGIGQPKHLLDVQVVDDAEVKNQIGYGALLCSLYHRPIEVWGRQ